MDKYLDDKYMVANIAFSKFCRDYPKLKNSLPIRPSEMGVLNIIVKRDGVFSPVRIAEMLGVSKPMIAAHISSLEEKGYVTRDYSSSDKRSFYVLPTEKAYALVEETAVRMGRHMQAIETGLGSEKFDRLIELLDETQGLLAQELAK